MPRNFIATPAACLLAVVWVLSSGRVIAGEALDSASLRAAIERSLPLLEQSAAVYTQQRKCFSCHHQALPAVALLSARRLGFQIDPAAARAQSDFTVDYYNGRAPSLRKGTGVPGGPFSAGYALWGLDAEGRAADETTEALVEYLLHKQQEDGSWRINTHRPPMEDSHFTATALSVIGLRLYTPASVWNEAQQRIRRAQSWLLENQPGTSEDRTFQLLGFLWSGAPRAAIDLAIQSLVEEQREDGGWAQKEDMTSDAYATGQSLYALRQAGLTSDALAIQRGLSYLIGSQEADGSWFVQTRSKPIQEYFESGFPHGKSQFISTAATAWSTAVLVLALGDLEAAQDPVEAP